VLLGDIPHLTYAELTIGTLYAIRESSGMYLEPGMFLGWSWKKMQDGRRLCERPCLAAEGRRRLLRPDWSSGPLMRRVLPRAASPWLPWKGCYAARIRTNSLIPPRLPMSRSGRGMNLLAGSTISSGLTSRTSRPRVRIWQPPAASTFLTH
jgi:hypothetical protein